MGLFRFSKKQKSESSGKSHAGIEKSKKEEQEFGPGQKDVMSCGSCGAFYYNKSWHKDLDSYKFLSENKDFKVTICAACKMIKDGRFEGQIIFENVPGDKKEEIINNIKNTGARAFDKDPMDRIITIKDDGAKLEVLTTENQLARDIARQVEKAFKIADKDIKWSKEESVARITVRFN